jgi:hypothetical protein
MCAHNCMHMKGRITIAPQYAYGFAANFSHVIFRIYASRDPGTALDLVEADPTILDGLLQPGNYACRRYADRLSVL